MGYLVGERDERPWGSWEVLAVGAGHAVKRIVVKPGKRLSLQRHAHRSEHWVIVSGDGKITKGEAVIPLAPGEAIFIPNGEKHRIENSGSSDLTFIEVQLGEHLDEADIERLEDDHGRVPPKTPPAP